MSEQDYKGALCQHGTRLTLRCRQCDERSDMMKQSEINRSEVGYDRADGKHGTETPENPKHFAGLKKVLMSCIPWPVIWELGVAMLEGALKYGRHNYRVVGQIRASTYFDGTMRHMTSWWEGEDNDPDSGLSHITKAIASNVVIRDAMIRGNFLDDRPPRMDPKVLADLNEKSRALMEKYPQPVAPYTQVDQSWSEAARQQPLCSCEVACRSYQELTCRIRLREGQAAALQRDVQENGVSGVV